MGDTLTSVSASTVVDRFYAAFNERDLDTWIGALDDDVQIIVDAGRFRGCDAARAYAEGIRRAYPGVVAADRRVVAESDDTVVSEFRLANPAAEIATPDGAPADGAWRLDGLVWEVVQLRDGRIVALRSYYSATETDRTDVAQVPSRAEAARIAQEHRRRRPPGRVAPDRRPRRRHRRRGPGTGHRPRRPARPRRGRRRSPDGRQPRRARHHGARGAAPAVVDVASAGPPVPMYRRVPAVLRYLRG
jgi:ketosteroid isomerase-like protein